MYKKRMIGATISLTIPKLKDMEEGLELKIKTCRKLEMESMLLKGLHSVCVLTCGVVSISPQDK